VGTLVHVPLLIVTGPGALAGVRTPATFGDTCYLEYENNGNKVTSEYAV
jgi:hypothetical protein